MAMAAMGLGHCSPDHTGARRVYAALHIHGVRDWLKMPGIDACLALAIVV